MLLMLKLIPSILMNKDGTCIENFIGILVPGIPSSI